MKTSAIRGTSPKPLAFTAGFLIMVASMRVLSKSGFIRGLKCRKALYLHVFQPQDRDEITAAQGYIFTVGHNVGALAQNLFPGGVDATQGRPGDIETALRFTAELIARGEKVIYEAAFSDGETLCFLDILVKRDTGWHGYEVKASTQVKDYHRNDVSFQYYVIDRSGLPLSGIHLVHINNQYIRRGEIDLHQLFTIEDLTGPVRDNQRYIPLLLKKLQEVLKAGSPPAIGMGTQCTHPFLCDFIGLCSGETEHFPLSDVTGISRDKALELKNRGITAFGDIPADFPFTRKEWELAEADMNQTGLRDQAALNAFKAGLEYPLHFMDFETFMPAVPIYNETRPYQQIPFQYSLHILRHPGGPLDRYDFLGTPPEDPRQAFVTSLLTHVDTKGSIVVYNKPFEENRLREIARDLPAYAPMIEGICGRLVDLMVPFRNRHLYHPAMKGSYSIKNVLPALVPELSYDDLEIREGGMASLIYMSLYDDRDPGSIEAKKQNLSDYCALDTLALVKLLEKM